LWLAHYNLSAVFGRLRDALMARTLVVLDLLIGLEEAGVRAA